MHPRTARSTGIVRGLALVALATTALVLPAGASAASPSTAAIIDPGCASAPADGAITGPIGDLRSRLDSEYLRRISADWTPVIEPPTIDVASPAYLLARMDSEYLRSLAAGWYPELVACVGGIA